MMRRVARRPRSMMRRVAMMAIAVAMVVTVVGSGLVSAQQQPFKGVELIVALRSLPETDYIMSRAGEFRSQTGIKLSFVLFPELQLREKLVLDATTRAGAYQVIAIDGGYVPEFAEAGWIVPLDRYIDRKWDVADILPKYREFLSHKGKLYALPVYGEATHLMYRKDLFDAAGVRPPKTMEELFALAEKFHKPPNMYGIAMRGLRGDGMNVYTWTEFLRSYGGDFWTPDWKPVLDSPQAIEGTRKYAELLRRFGPPGVATYSWDDVQTAFMAGKVAMIIDATNFFTRIENSAKSAIAGKIGYATVPAGPAGRYPGIYAMGFAISAIGAKTERERQAAALFIQWATSKEIEMDKALSAGIVSVTRRSVFNHPAFRAKYGKYNGWLESTVESLEIAMTEYRPRIPEWREIGNRIGIAIEEVLAGLKSPEVAMREANEYARKVFKQTGKLK